MRYPGWMHGRSRFRHLPFGLTPSFWTCFPLLVNGLVFWIVDPSMAVSPYIAKRSFAPPFSGGPPSCRSSFGFCFPDLRTCTEPFSGLFFREGGCLPASPLRGPLCKGVDEMANYLPVRSTVPALLAIFLDPFSTCTCLCLSHPCRGVSTPAWRFFSATNGIDASAWSLDSTSLLYSFGGCSQVRSTGPADTTP